jgi:uncharacterized protein (TIGR03435 family)
MRIAIAVLILAGSALAQSPGFEVATIRVNDSGSGGSGFPGLRNGVLAGRNISLKMMLQEAFGFSPLRIVGPDWLDTLRFDLAGKAPQGVPDTGFMPMLQALLKERFHVEVHREMREMPVYEMLIASGGVKMLPYDPARKFDGINPHGNMIFAPSVTMPELAVRMTASAGRPVVDKTGLEGRYSVVLIFMRLEATAAETAAADAPPDFFTAVQQQLGLKLESKKEPIEVLVVDHADRMPTEN